MLKQISKNILRYIAAITIIALICTAEINQQAKMPSYKNSIKLIKKNITYTKKQYNIELSGIKEMEIIATKIAEKLQKMNLSPTITFGDAITILTKKHFILIGHGKIVNGSYSIIGLSNKAIESNAVGRKYVAIFACYSKYLLKISKKAQTLQG